MKYSNNIRYSNEKAGSDLLENRLVDTECKNQFFFDVLHFYNPKNTFETCKEM